MPFSANGRHVDGERRRASFKRFMSKHGLKPAEWAKKADLPNANSIYNFLNGHSDSLSQRVLEGLIRVVPGTNIHDVIGGGPDRSGTANVPLLTVRATAEFGSWRCAYETNPGHGAELQIAIPPRLPVDEALKILDEHCNLVYPRNSYVCVQALLSLDRLLRDGDMVLVHAISAERQHEVTVRRVIERPSNKLALTFASKDVPSEPVPLEIPSPYDGQSFSLGDRARGQIRGLVRMAVIMDAQ